MDRFLWTEINKRLRDRLLPVASAVSCRDVCLLFNMMEVKLLVLYLTVLWVLLVGLTEVNKQQHLKCFRLVVWVGVWSAAAPHHHILPLLTEMLPLCTLTHWCMLLFLWLFLPLFDQQWSIGGRERAEARGSGSNPNSGRHISSPPAPGEDAFLLFSVTWSEDNYLFFIWR